jgi:ring-1,2-phenylacetyl-CoA epoxidase subunit PaaC
MATAPQFDYVLRLADACLVHGQRLSEWCGHAPVLEEDIALANVALDHIGQARSLLTLAGELEGRGRDEDALAYQRGEREYRNVTMLELPNGDFARTVLRGFLWASFMKVMCTALAGSSSNAQLAAIAAKSLKEVRYHQRHLGDWVVRLGDGTDESHRRAAEALAMLWPYAAEWFEDDALDRDAAAAGLGPTWSALKADWLGEVEPVFAEAGLLPAAETPFRSTGKQGRHSEHMGFLLAEMQSLQRAFPGAVW